MEKKLRYLLKEVVAIFIILTISGCGKDDDPTSSNATGSIKGKITIQTIGVPVISASVGTNPQTVSVITDASGNYTISDISTGTYTVTASKGGYSSNSVSVTVTQDNISTADIQLAMGNSLPAPPQPVFPSNNAVNKSLSFAFSWNASPGASSYKLEVSLNSSFTEIIEDARGISGTNKKIEGLNPNTQYWWRVSSVNAFGTSEPSFIWSFTTGNGIQGQPCPGVPTVLYEGKTYNTVQIGSQCWFKENLDVGTMITADQNSSDDGVIEKICYNDDPNNCAVYGALYQWSEAMQYNYTPGTKGICPQGWHIPTIDELQILALEVGNDGNSLKAEGEGFDSGAGTNTSGFSALLTGSRNGSNRFTYLNMKAVFWSSNIVGAYDPNYLLVSEASNYIELGAHGISYGESIRCLKN